MTRKSRLLAGGGVVVVAALAVAFLLMWKPAIAPVDPPAPASFDAQTRLAQLSIGGIDSVTTFYRGGYLSETQRQELIALGTVGDVLFHPFDIEGRVVDHPLNNVVMSVDVDRLRKAPMRILTSGGEEKTEALVGAMKLLTPTVLITDEESARRILELTDDPAAS